MTTFRNGYHFVPRLPNDASAKGRSVPLDPRDFGLRPSHESEGHAIYAEEARSGRISCRITLECPSIIGSVRLKAPDRVSPTLVAPFMFDDRPAIPASSLKGMISLIAESAARAPYRVLRDMQLTVAYSVRDQSAGGKLFTVRHRAIDGKSGISRGDIKGSTRMESSRAYFDPSLHPLEIKGKTIPRALINPVESMFGFVAEAERGQENAGRGKVNAAAGKLRLSHAIPSGAWADKEVAAYFLKGNVDQRFDKVPKGVSLTLLKEQGEPMKKPKRQPDHEAVARFSAADYDKLNSATPNFYFFDKQNPGKFISKKGFATNPPGRYTAQGAKFYLHNPASLTSEPWKSTGPKRGVEGIDRKAAAAVLKAGITFDFHIDFDNLTGHELNILCFALRPSPRFRHKIGLGKGLGLGSIRLDVTGLVLIDRKARYEAAAIFEDDPRHVASETGAELAAAFALQHSGWLEENDKGAKTALLAIGETHDFDGEGGGQEPVLWVPLTEERYQAVLAGRASAEDKSFEWFTINDQAGGQKLRPIGADGVPTLETNASPPRNNGFGQGSKGATPRSCASRTPPAASHKPVRPQSGHPTRVAEGSRTGKLLRVGTTDAGAEFGKVIDDETGQQFHVPPPRLKEAGLSAQDVGGKVRFTSQKIAPERGDHAVFRVKRA